MRAFQRHQGLRLLLAGSLGIALTFLLWKLGTIALCLVLAVALTTVAFVALTIAPDAIAHWRHHPWRWWWRASDGEGPFWPGTRIPQHPRR